MTKIKLTQIEGDYIMSIELKIKSKHLSEEAKIIRTEENKFLKQWKWECAEYKNVGNNEPLNPYGSTNFKQYRSLNCHRRLDVRNENRATYLARAYLEGKAYNTVEHKRKEENEYIFRLFIIPRVIAMVAKYGEKTIDKEIMTGTFPNKKKVKNPEYIDLENSIKSWAELHA